MWYNTEKGRIMKKIGIITTGGDCSGLNTAIARLVAGGALRGHKMFGVLDGMDGLMSRTQQIIQLDVDSVPIHAMRLSGSFLKNGDPKNEDFADAARAGKMNTFQSKLKKGIEESGLDALILIGGNGSLSLAVQNMAVYSSVQLVCIPKTVDFDVPMTDATIGFNTAVNQLAAFCDQLLLTARSHHRWFVVQTMGRDTGHIALHTGLATGADAIIIPEVKFSTENLVKHIKKSGRDFGIILVAEGIKIRGHSGTAADMIARELLKGGIAARTAFPGYIQRTGDTSATDKILATRFADAALDAVDNNETFVMTSLVDNEVVRIPLLEMFADGKICRDPNIRGADMANSFVDLSSPLLRTASQMGVYIGEIKK
ncbi:MAG: 6-phosphofructokinase [Rickettsiales bacterium]|nr:6-phosphofructokinase [Rickettsiales bacterium]